MNYKAPAMLRLVFLGLLTIIVFVVSVGIGAVVIAPMGVVNALVDASAPNRFIVAEYRLPRTLGAALAGASLALAGMVLQFALRNPLASPDVVGVSKGAGFGAVLAIMLLPGVFVPYMPLAVILGALLAAAVLLGIAKFDLGSSGLALVGLAVGALFQAATTLVLVKSNGDANQAMIWLTGSMYGTTMEAVLRVGISFALLYPFVVGAHRWLDLARFGDPTVVTLGADPRVLRYILIGVAVILAAMAVSVAGAISFLGLLAPHLASSAVGHRPRVGLPGAALIGAILLMVADAVGRILVLPAEVPAGVVVAVIGAPYFIYLLWRQSHVRG